MVQREFYYEHSKYKVQVYVPVKSKFESATIDHCGANDTSRHIQYYHHVHVCAKWKPYALAMPQKYMLNISLKVRMV